jgi:hypothetical protein
MITFLGYEEIRRFNEERVTRSVKRQSIIEAMRATPPPPSAEGEVIELAFTTGCDDQQKLGA